MDTPDEVAAWVADHERQHGNGLAGLRVAMARGIIAGRGATVARAWLDEQANGGRQRLEAEQLDLARRATTAAEASASAAIDSAAYARESAKWAKICALIAVFALLVSAWPFIKDVGRP